MILSEDIRGLKSQPRDIPEFVELGQCHSMLRVTKTVLGFSPGTHRIEKMSHLGCDITLKGSRLKGKTGQDT